MGLNLLSLLPSTVLTVLLITVAFLRFYDQTDFEFLGIIAHPRVWSNRFTVAAVLATLANLGVEWNRRNRETNRLAQETQRRNEEAQRRTEEEQRRTEEAQRRIEDDQRRTEDARRRAEEAGRAESDRLEAREREARRTRIETRCHIAEIQFQLDPSEQNRKSLRDILAVLAEYGEIL